MEWIFKLLGRPAKKTAQNVSDRPPAGARKPVRTPAMERAAVLSKDEWVAERLQQTPITQLAAVRGVQMAHVQTLQNAGIANLLQARQAHSLPLMGATNEVVQEWLQGFIADLDLEYAQLRHVALTAMP